MTAETLALFAAGIIWPFVFQSLGKFGLDNRVAQLAAIAVAFGLGALAHIATGGSITLDGIMQAGSPVVAVSLIVYRQVIKPSPSPAPTLPSIQ